MAISGVGTTSTSTAEAAAAMKKSTGLNKDDFLQLFVAQLKNQDPLNPQDSSEFVAQLAQLTQVEQAYNTNTNLKDLISTVNGTASLNASSMIGRNVTAAGDKINFSGAATQVSYDLPVASSATSIVIRNSAGNVVRTINAGVNASGQNSVAWDGKADNGTIMPTGVYNFTATGKASDGSSIAATTYTTGKVDGIAFNGSQPIIKVGTIEIPLSAVAGIS